MTNDNRQNWLKKLIGAGEADSRRQDMRDAKEILDGMGVERKDLDAVKEALRPIATDLANKATAYYSASGSTQAVADEDLISLILSALMEGIGQRAASADTNDADNDPAEPESAVEGEETPAGEGDVEEDLKTVLKGLADHIAQTTEDQGELAKNQVDLQDMLEKHGDVLKALVERVDGIEQKVAGRPRQASKAGETELPSADELEGPLADVLKVLEGDARKGLQGDKKFLNIPVTEEPT